MLYIIGFQDKETSYVWDTDDFTIEKISNYDIAKAQVGGVYIENLPTLSLRALLDIKKGMKLYFSFGTSLFNIRALDKLKTGNDVYQVSIDYTDLLTKNKSYSTEDLVWIIKSSKDSYFVHVWYKGWYYRFPENLEYENGVVESIDPIYIGTYRGKLRIGLLEVNRGLMCLVCNKGSASSVRNGKVTNLYSAEMDKNTFKRKVILGVC